MNRRLTQPSRPECGGIVPIRLGRVWRALDHSLHRILWRTEIIALAAIIALLNLPLLTGTFSTEFAFHPGAVKAGEWWRVLTHPFVHVSWYHLVLDAAAFFLAYLELRQRPFGRRLLLILATGGGSLLAALLFSPAVQTLGLCGLSGIAHGLTAVVSLDILRRETGRLVRAGAIACFITVVGKCLFEAVTGHVVFESWHLGSLGTPIAVCHAGGVLGALSAWLYFDLRSQPEF
jgi:rhomboid family GlyGly-CTERM serine protease